ncbi:MAG: hypothetical protein ACREQ7_19250 [Candidatus Binatia bacterium]
MKITQAVAIAIITVSPLVGYAQPGISVWGAGLFTCGEWIEHTKRAWPRAQYTDWVLGFLTSYNYYNPSQQVAPPDRASVSAWIDKYCRDNPLDRQFMAAAALLEELGGPKAKHQWKR